MACNGISANLVSFGDVCDLLEQVLKKKKADKKNLLLKFINDFKVNVDKKNSSFYPILRLLVPKYERERKAYDMKENTLGRLLVKVLGLPKQSHDYEKLLKPKGDFADTAYFVFKNGVCHKNSKLTVGDVNDLLDRIANAEVGIKGPILDEIFSYAMKSLTAIEMKWFIRIILKDLKIGVSSNVILACYHPDAPELYNACSSLPKVCEELDETKLRPMEMGIEVFYAVHPMLSERLDVTEVGQLPRATYLIEEKFDGERFQVHMDGGKFEYFSRRGFSFTSKFGGDFETGMVTPLLKDCFSPNVTSFILDGEMMGWHKDYRCFGSKGMAFDVKKITENSKFRPCFCVFDLMYYNGKSLVGPPGKGGLPLRERLGLLDSMFTDIPGVILHSKRDIVKKSSDILDALNKINENGGEGIVIKDTESYYIANSRNAGWYKIKPEYTEGAIDDLDLVIIGVDMNQSRVKSYVVACADILTPGELPHRWLCMGRVATGLTHDQHDTLSTHLKQHWKQTDRVSPPDTLVFNKITPDYWILPEHSIVIEVRATELIKSTDFATSHTLRFPRIKKIREDKPVKDILTLDQLNNLVANKGPVQKMATKRINEDQISEAEIKTRRKRIANVPQVLSEFKKISHDDVVVTSRALEARKIWIVSDDEDCKREELVRIVESHGGKVVATIGKDTWISVVGRMTVRAVNLLSHDCDVTTTAWLRSLPSSNTPCTISPLDMLSIKKETRMKMAMEYDPYGDSYKEEVDEDTLKKCIQKMDFHEPPIYPTKSEMLELDKELFGGHSPHSFLRPYNMHIVNSTRLALHAKMYGATLCDITDKKLTHVVVPNKDLEQVNSLKETCCDTAVFIKEDWLNSCLEQGKPIMETAFLL